MNKKIYLFCSAGMSTSLLASKMKNFANQNNLLIEVEAFPYAEIDKIVEQRNPDCILLGPQVKFMLKGVKAKFDEKTPVDVINSVDYGSINGERVLKTAINMIKSRQAK